MLRFLSGLLTGAMLATAGAAVAAVTVGDARISWPDLGLKLDTEPLVESARNARHVIHSALPEPEPREVTVVLDRDGARLYAGPDNAALGLSSVLASNGIPTLDVPAFRGSDRKWASIKKCVERNFSNFRVNIVDEPPASGDYMVAHVGGPSRMLGQPNTVRGLAPHSGRVIANAVVFVFQPRNASASDLCRIASHEIGHAIGLDHVRVCSDIMSYQSCGKKAFRNRAGACGEYEARACDDGEPTQNSYEVLRRRVGLRPEPGPAVS